MTQNELDVFFMRQAISEARKAFSKGEVPIGCVIAHGERVIGRGHNLVETLADATAHAEMQAITAAASAVGGKYLQQCTLYVTLEPCPMCAGAANWSQLGRIVWGSDDPKRGFMRFGNGMLHPKTQTTKGILEDECSALLINFFSGLRRPGE